MKTICINQCTQEDLEWLPGVGPATAKKVIEARPIQDIGALQGLIPPSAWLKIQEAGVEFAFEDGQPEEPPKGVLQLAKLSDEQIEALKEKWAETYGALAIISEPPIVMQQESQPITLRRVMPGQQLKSGASYICIWNMRWGPQGEAVTPRDSAVQVEVETKLLQYSVGIQFAHYAPSVRVRTHSYGPIPLVLFEIIEETQNGTDNEGNGEGD
jgi:hypothetical protein